MKKVAIVILALLLLLSISYVRFKIKTKEKGNDKMVHEHKKEVTEKRASGIRGRMCDIISGEFKQLIEEKVTRWSFHNTGKGSVKTFEGKTIFFSGKYNDQRKELFLNYIESYERVPKNWTVV